MEHIRTRPAVWLVFSALALLAASRLAGGPHGPACAEAVVAQPGFSVLATGPGPACIRIHLP